MPIRNCDFENEIETTKPIKYILPYTHTHNRSAITLRVLNNKPFSSLFYLFAYKLFVLQYICILYTSVYSNICTHFILFQVGNSQITSTTHNLFYFYFQPIT